MKHREIYEGDLPLLTYFSPKKFRNRIAGVPTISMVRFGRTSLWDPRGDLGINIHKEDFMRRFHMFFLFALIIGWSAFAHANCIVDAFNKTTCGNGTCVQDAFGHGACSKISGGGCIVDGYGKAVCGAGQCVVDHFGKGKCGSSIYGQCLIDRDGYAVCGAGECLLDNVGRAVCSKVRGGRCMFGPGGNVLCD